MKIHEYNEMMAYLTRPSYASGGRVGFKHGGSWADWMSNHSDQMTFEEYLQMDMDKSVHPINKSAGGRVGMKPGGLVEPGGYGYTTTNIKKIKKPDHPNFGKWTWYRRGNLEPIVADTKADLMKKRKKAMKITKASHYDKLIEATQTRLDFKKQSMDELMAKVEELSKNPKYKTVKDIEREVFKFFDQEKYLRRQGPEFLFFDKAGKNFSFPRDYSIEGWTIGKKKLAERKSLLRQIIGMNMFKNNPNHKNAAALLTKFYTQNPKRPTFKPTTAERNIMLKFLNDFSFRQSLQKGGGLPDALVKNLNFNLDNVIKNYTVVLSNEEKFKTLLQEGGLDSKTKALYEDSLKQIKKNRLGLFARLKDEIPNLFRRKAKSGFFQIEHRVGQALGLTEGFQLPKDYMARATYVPGRFNQAKLYTYDSPLRNLIAGYNEGTPEEKLQYKDDIKKLNKNFNARTKGYLNPLKFTFGNVVNIQDKTPYLKDVDEASLSKELRKNMKHSNAFFESYKGNKIPGIRTKPETMIISQDQINNFDNYIKTAKNVKGSGKVKAVTSIAALVGGYAADKVLKKHGISLTQEENEKVLEASMLPGDLIKEHPVTSAAVAGTTLRASKRLPSDPLKTVRRAVHTPVTWPLKKMIRSLGTPLAGAGFAGWRIHDNLKAGESVADAVVDPIVGAELAFPSLFKENISKIIPDKYQGKLARAGRGLLGLGKVGSRFMGPVGVAVGATGSVYDAYKDYERRKEFLTPERIAEAQKEEFDVDEPMFNQGGRVGFSKGPKDPSKRLFLKGVGALSLIPILGKYFKLTAPATKAAAQYTGPVLEGLSSKLKWVQLLAKRLWNEGEDVTEKVATAERQIVKRGTLESGDKVDMVYDVNTKDVHFEVASKGGFDSASGAYEQGYQLGYRAPQVIEEGKQAGKKTKAEVEVAESRPHQVTPEDVELEGDVTTVEDAVSDLTELEAFAKKKTVKEIHKKKGTTPKDTNPTWEPPEYDWDDFGLD